MPGPFTRFRPFDLKPGEQRGLLFTGVYAEPCRDRGTGSVDWESVPVKFRFLWRTETVDIPLPDRLAFVFRKEAACSSG